MQKAFVKLAPVLAAALAPVAAAQTSPFVDEKIERHLVNELSGDLAFETLRIATQWHKLSGSPDYVAAARYVLEKAKAAGLSDVRWIDQVSPDAAWSCRRAEAWLIEGSGAEAKELKLASSAEVATSIADFSRSADVSAGLVDVGAGERPADYEGRDVRGKIVLASGNPAAVTLQAVWKRGAAGILSWASTRTNALADSADQIAWLRVPREDGPAGQRTTFAFVLSPRAGKGLSDRLRQGGAPLFVHAVVDAAFGEKKTAMIEARIPGADPALPEVLLTSHLQEEKFSANDDLSGVASMLEIGRALARLIAEGKLPRPRRGIRFWWCDEAYSELRYFADHPGEEKKILAALNQDMVGARQSAGDRAEFLTRMPWSRPSYLADVQESVLDLVVRGNTGYLAAWQVGSNPPGEPFSKPIFSRLGTREPYAAQAVPDFNSTEHAVFNEPWIGVPATALMNWPDESIHSSGDDLSQIDPTQLERNAFVVAATAWWLATAGDGDAAFLASFVAGKAAERLARDASTASAWLRTGRGTPAERYRAAANLLAVSVEMQKQAVASTAALGAKAELLAARAAALDRLAQVLRAELDAAFAGAHPGLRPPDASPSDVEKRLAARIPRRSVATLAEWMALERAVHQRRARERRVRPAPPKKPAAPAPDDRRLGMHMQLEAMSWIDGKRSAAEISRRVCAEALSAGWWYYGEATPALVEKLFEAKAKDGLILW